MDKAVDPGIHRGWHGYLSRSLFWWSSQQLPSNTARPRGQQHRAPGGSPSATDSQPPARETTPRTREHRQASPGFKLPLSTACA